MPETVLPETIDRYHVLAELGRGAMGRVYLAEDPRIKRRIALKVLTANDALDERRLDELRKRFLSEAQAAGRLNHSGIVTVFDAATDPLSGAPYMTMEWVEGRSLRDILRDEGALTIPQAVDLAAQVAAALDHAHRQNVVHRDIKPENLMVTTDGTVKVTDFGIAKLGTQSLTMTGHMIGTPYYMAPEQVKAEKVDGRTDLFALGLVLYECLTGQIAFDGDTLANITHKIIWVDPEPPEMYNGAIAPRLRQLLDRVLQKQADDRFQTGKELEKALRAVAEDLHEAPSPKAAAPEALADSEALMPTVDMHPLERGASPTALTTAIDATESDGEPEDSEENEDDDAEIKARPGFLRRALGLAVLVVLLPFLTVVLVRGLERWLPQERWAQAPDWMHHAPERMSRAPGWMQASLERMNEAADWLWETPRRFFPAAEVDPDLPTADNTEAAAHLENPAAAVGEEIRLVLVLDDLGPVYFEKPEIPPELVTWQDLAFLLAPSENTGKDTDSRQPQIEDEPED